MSDINFNEVRYNSDNIEYLRPILTSLHFVQLGSFRISFRPITYEEVLVQHGR